MTIWFNSYVDEYAWLSTFAAVDLLGKDGRTYQSAEAAYQAAKTSDAPDRDLIANARSAGLAKALGKRVRLRANWMDVRVDVMRRILEQKHSTEPFRELLLATGDEELVHLAPWDTYWGMKRSRVGQNVLGELLMNIRAELRS
jgi:ribA/ribD-fused uncharacterized protein